jgi:hypothetical protein
MSKVVRIAAAIYVAQAVTGFVIGFTLPWLHLLGVI